MGLFVRNGTYYVTFMVNGRQKMRSCRTKNPNEAFAKAREIIAEHQVARRADSTERRRARILLPAGGYEWQENIDKAIARRTSWVGQMYQRAKDRARRRELPFTLSFERFVDVLRRCNGYCEVSGIAFDFHDQARIAPFAPSLDRVEAARGYTNGNIRIVCNCVNAALGNWGEDVFWKMVAQAAKQLR